MGLQKVGFGVIDWIGTGDGHVWMR
jgi:hypothetical protein